MARALVESFALQRLRRYHALGIISPILEAEVEVWGVVANFVVHP